MPATSVTKLASVVCLSKKQFERLFNELVGANPKEYARIVRFQKSLKLLQHCSKIQIWLSWHINAVTLTSCILSGVQTIQRLYAIVSVKCMQTLFRFVQQPYIMSLLSIHSLIASLPCAYLT